MFYFDKKTYYIDYYENGSRMSNAGFISLTFKDEECLVHIGLRNLPGSEHRTCRWFGLVDSEQIFLEEFRVEKGKADFVNSYRISHFGRTGTDFRALEGFYFALGKKRWGSCFFEKHLPNTEPVYENIVMDPLILAAAGGGKEKGQTEDVKENLSEMSKNRILEKEINVTEETVLSQEETGNQEDNDRTTVPTDWDSYETEKKETGQHRTTWEELIQTHQLVHPFDDQGDYISINPFTLKLLAPEYRKLANNSFLLHGFYNYRHIILGYYQDDQRQGYYIGVPGTFDEREQMVAEMFGFEGYEPAGGVGYYMRKVEL